LAGRAEAKKGSIVTRRLVTITAATAAHLLALFAVNISVRAQTGNLSSTVTARNPTANPASEGDGNQLEQLTVTGYLIPRVGDGPQPVTSYDQDYIGKTGYQTVTDVLQNLPTAVGNFGPNTTTGFSFSPGSASIGLKGLPPNDTLVLVDGLRYPQYPFPQPTTVGIISFVDLNSIPIAAVDRIEILNDGGSATYGNDAIAGVVNVILKNEYDGGDILHYFGVSQRGDEEIYHGSFVGGVTQKFGDTSKLSVVATFDYYSQGPIMLLDRQNSSLEFSRLSSKYPDEPISPDYAGQFTDPSGNFYQIKPGTTPPITASDFFITPGAITPSPLSEFNQKYVQLLPREDRLGGLIKLTYQATDWLKFYDYLTIERNEELSSYGPNQGVPNSNRGVTVPANNPFNPFGVPLTIQGLALGEFGPYRSDTTVTTIRNIVGANMQLPRDWLVDANFLYGESDGIQTVNNNFTVTGLQAALDGTLPGHVGQFFNPFADESVVGPNRAFYGDKQLVASIWEEARTEILQYHVTAGGTLVELPAGALTVAGGFEYRSELFIQDQDKNSKFANVTDPQYSLGTLASSRRYIWSIFGEADIPIVGNQWSWPGLRDIDVALSERQDYYSDFGSSAKPKVAVRYKPFSDLTFRATYSEGFVAPSLPELFGAPIIGSTSVIDPKNPQFTLPVLAQVNGNSKLKPENAYTYYVGGVWSPGSVDPEHSWWGWANGFSAYINWFQVDIHNVVGTLAPQNVVDLGGRAPSGNFVVRNVNGLITEVTESYLNLGNSRSNGIEFGLNYVTKEHDWGKLDADFGAVYLYNVSTRTVQGVLPSGAYFYRVFNETDTFGAPDLKFLLSVFYSKTIFGIDTFRMGLTLHYTGSELDAMNSANGTNPTATLVPAGYVHTIGSWTTLDWQVSYRFGRPEVITPEAPKPGYDKEGKKISGENAVGPAPRGPSGEIRSLLANTSLVFGINNIFDTYPPLSVDNLQVNYDTSVGSPTQRFFYVEIEKQF
jgi:iron complex outermembrane recepter protein